LLIEEYEGSRIQRYGEPPADLPFQSIDLSGLMEEGQREAMEISAAQVQRSLRLDAGDLIRIREYDLGRKGRRLLLVIHHLAVDGVSWRILLEDLEALYKMFERGEKAFLSPKTTSFRHWSERLSAYGGGEELRQEAEYWLAADRERAPASLPIDEALGENTIGSARRVSVELSARETSALLHLAPAIHQTQINDVLLTAVALACCSWSGDRVVWLDLEGHGREDIFDNVDLSRTVGWFTTVFPMRLSAEVESNGPSVGATLGKVKEQLRAAPGRGRNGGHDARRAAALAREPRPRRKGHGIRP